jgi:hypothetical protein
MGLVAHRQNLRVTLTDHRAPGYDAALKIQSTASLT